MIVFFVGCWHNSTEDKIYGTWEYTYLLDNEYFKKNSKEPIPKDLEINMEIKSVESYHKGGIYNAIGEVIIRYKAPQGELPLKFFIKDVGTWSFHADGKEIVATSTDGAFTPMDKISEAALKESPMLAALFQPIKGTTVTSHILSISKDIMEVKVDGLEETVIMNKKY